jgi:tRNA-Thr(GGU) m(6)t(6)A37 methyltransferase TsaA
MRTEITLRPIGVIRSCYREKFGVPRQAGLAPSARATLEIPLGPESRDALRGLEGFSHLWVIFWFHGVQDEGWRPLVRPPRLGGTRKMGVFASRSPHRPNPIGLSAVRLEGIELEGSDLARIEVSGGDFLDGTPVLDIKPYLPYADSIPSAHPGWAEPPLPRMEVAFSPEAEHALEGDPNLRQLVLETVGLDPRPAFQASSASRGEGVEYSCRIAELDVHWVVLEGRALVTRIERLALWP